MLDIPQWAAAADGWDYGVVVHRRRRACGPLECPRIPWIISRRLASEVRPKQINGEYQHSRGLKDNADAYDEIPDVPSTARLIGVDAARHPQKPRYVHEIEREMEADEKQQKCSWASASLYILPETFGHQ
jgi:hypothetical protein